MVLAGAGVGARLCAARLRTATKARLLPRVRVEWIPRAGEPKDTALCPPFAAPESAVSRLFVLPRKRCPTEIPLSCLGIPAVTSRAGRLVRIVRLLKW